MSIKTVLFDLDGTLLPMDQELFVKMYFKTITKKVCESLGIAPDLFMKAMLSGVDAMQDNDGKTTNEEAFWKVFLGILKIDKTVIEPVLESYYENEFCKLEEFCGFNENAKKTIEYLKSKNVSLVLATNPVFPPVAVKERLSWAGLSVEDFEYITTYDNSHTTKPDTSYYNEILQRLSLDPRECLMVGNDVRDDMEAERAGLAVFLLTDCLINMQNSDISRYDRGDFSDLAKYIEKVI